MGRIAVLLAAVTAVTVGSAATGPPISGTIAFESASGPHPDVIVTSVEGRPQQRFASTLAGEAAPTWSPDGTQIAFTSDRTGLWHLYAAGSSGKAVPIGRAGAASEVDPAWSPDGKRIAFATTDAKGLSHISLAVVGTRGSAADLTSGVVIDGDPSWSPQGDRIAFDRVSSGRSDLWAVDLRGKAAPLTRGSALDEANPTWAPDGKHIAFDADDAKGNIDVYVLDLATGEEQRLTQEPGLDFQPAWSPDGTQIAFTSDRGGDWDIWLMNADGTGARDLSRNPKATDDSPAWRPASTRNAPRSVERALQAAFICDLPIGSSTSSPTQNPRNGDGLPNKLCGDGSPSTISGSGGDDRIDGGGGNDRLNGNTGNDTIYACAGVSPDRDIVDGGAGTSDTAWVRKSGANIDTWINVEWARGC
jgi:Tol biopolymer transport system component